MFFVVGIRAVVVVARSTVCEFGCLLVVVWFSSRPLCAGVRVFLLTFFNADTLPKCLGILPAANSLKPFQSL